MKYSVLILLGFSFLLLSCAENNAEQNKKKAAAQICVSVSDQNENFRKNCITCHSFMNENISQGGVTLLKISQWKNDSLDYYFQRSLVNKQHSGIDTIYFRKVLFNK